MKILITGGAGYIGYSLVSQLEKNSKVKEIIVFDNLSKSKNNFLLLGPKLGKTSFVKGDLLNLTVLNDKIKGVDIIIHLAAEVSFPFSNEDHFKYEQINQYGTLNLVRFLEDKNISKLIYMSSSAVYGNQENCIETTPTLPVNAYGRSKLMGEQYVQLLKNRMEVQMLRSANVFGFNPCMRTDAVMNQFFIDALLYNKLSIFGDGEQKRSFVCLKSLVQEIENCLEGKKKEELFNVLDCNMSVNEIRDFLISKNQTLEFTYVASSSNYGSTTMKLHEEHSNQKDKFQTLNSFYNELKKSIRIELI